MDWTKDDTYIKLRYPSSGGGIESTAGPIGCWGAVMFALFGCCPYWGIAIYWLWKFL